MNTQKNINVAIAEDHTLMRKGLIEIISSFKDFSINIEAENGKELINKLQKTSYLPNICILDINMPIMNGYLALLTMKKNWPDIKILILTMYDNEYSIIQMLKNGANGYMLKNSDPKELQNALMSVYSKGFYHTELVSGKLMTMVQNKMPQKLKLNEREISFLSLCCSELSYKEIALEMNLSFHTIEGYRDALFEKLNVHTRTGLVLYAMNMGINKC